MLGLVAFIDANLAPILIISWFIHVTSEWQISTRCEMIAPRATYIYESSGIDDFSSTYPAFSRLGNSKHSFVTFLALKSAAAMSSPLSISFQVLYWGMHAITILSVLLNPGRQV